MEKIQQEATLNYTFRDYQDSQILFVGTLKDMYIGKRVSFDTNSTRCKIYEVTKIQKDVVYVKCVREVRQQVVNEGLYF